MSYPIPTFQQSHQLIVQEIRNKTGISIPADSDASIRADGTASIVEGLYHHQSYILKQLFIQTADEPFLYIHAEELDLPRHGGTRASGRIKATSNTDITIAAGAKLTNGKGYYWSVVTSSQVKTGVPTTIEIVADQIGGSWNVSTEKLLWVSPAAGLNGTAEVISIGGGSDQEELEAWRARLLERKQLGFFRDREADLISAIKKVPGVQHVYVYPKRRGLGSLDVAITAIGTPPVLPSTTLLQAVQAVLDAEAGFWADCRAYAPNEQYLDVTATITGQDIDVPLVEKTIRDYFLELQPADAFLPAVLVSRIMALSNVVDVKLTPDTNVVPTVNWMYTYWLRAGKIVVV
ncbi:baseplate J/gp47 family protein [Acinetobacter sp. V102_4]|uniref:baseplate J/gp47 family protein n=1 Tax=Acinetobacter sp. V102_4 TaxID=3072984 RepID=UPI00287D8B75|nr:baseplate J/gp47 family protein [Acinetobacter sp. V102_4]MDS7929633.1 baseplate J/gp47 family protein [Acinetobacter sp. V102_4]